MPMKAARIAIMAVLAVGIFAYLAATRQGVQHAPPQPADAAQNNDPLKVPIVAHMKEIESIDFGTTTTADVAVARRGAEVEVVLSEKFLKRLGPGALDSLQMASRDEVMSWGRYNRFLASLHDLLVALNPHAHEGHAHEGAEHEEKR